MLLLESSSLLITHYNRSASLERLLRSFRDIGVVFAKVVVSDDGSQPEHLEKLTQLQSDFRFQLVTTPVNRGLGNNINKGQDQITTPYTLYVQEDFLPTAAFPQAIARALNLMEQEASIDLIRFYNHDLVYPGLRPFRDQFSDMDFCILRPGTAKFFCYSDTPHLRRQDFFKRFGRYSEGVKAIKCEKSMVMSVLQAKGRCLIADKNDIFVHENSEDEPSTQDYSDFFRIRRLIPGPIFTIAWTAKLTMQFLFRKYRNDQGATS